MRALRTNHGYFIYIDLPRPAVPLKKYYTQNRFLLEGLGSEGERVRDFPEYVAHEYAWIHQLVILGRFLDPGRPSESDAHTRHTTTRGTTQRGQKWAMVTDWTTALACVIATEIAWLASVELFFTQFANTSAAR